MNLRHALAAVLYPWIMYQISGSVLWAAAIAAVIVSLLAIGLIVGGYLADLVGFRDIALAASNLASVTALAVAAFYAMNLLTPSLFLTLAVIGAILDGPAAIAVEARLPEIARLSKVSENQAGVIDDIIDSIVIVSSPATAGFLLTTVGVPGLMWAIAAISVIGLAFLSLSLPRFRLYAAPTLGDTLESARWFRQALGTPHLLLGGSFALGFFITMQIFLVPAALAVNAMPAELLGLSLTGAAAGMIVVNVLHAVTKPRDASNDVPGAALMGLSASVALLSFNMSPLMLLVSGLLAGLSGGLLSPIYAALPQARAPRHLRSSVLGLAYAVLVIFLPAQLIAAGILIYLVSVKTTFVISAIALLAAALIYHCWFVD